MTAELPEWFLRVRELYSLAQAGLTYSKDIYDLERYKRLREIAAEMIASRTEFSKDSILESFSAQVGYATPKIDVRGAVIRDGRILLVQERVDGNWSMPGGYADIGEVPSAMVAREVLEESGFTVSVDKLVAVYDANRIPPLAPLNFYHSYKLIFLCSITGGEARPSMETSSVDFFHPDHLPVLSVRRTSREMLAEVFAHVVDPARPAAFD